MLLQNNKMIISYFILTLLTLFTFNFSVIEELADEWYNPGPYNHGFLCLGMALYIFWTKRTFFTRPHPNYLGLLLLLAANMLLLMGNLANIGQLQTLSLSLIVVALFISLYGFVVIQKFIKVWLILLFTLPIWNIIQLPLQDLSTWVGFHSVHALGFDIIRNGHELMTPGGVFIVEPACSGLGFFLASAVYAIFVSQLNNLSYKSSGIYLFLSLAIAIIANWLRIIIIVIVGSQTHMQAYIVKDHLTFGWFVFMGCFIPLIIIGHLYFAEQPIKNKKATSKTEPSNQSLWPLLYAPIIVIAFSIGTFFISTRFDNNYQLNLPQIPTYTHIKTTNMINHSWFPISHGATSEIFSYFLQGDNLYQIYLANYVKQSQGNEMIFIKNRLFDNNRWYNERQQTITLDGSSALAQLNLITLQKNNERSRLIAYWYLIDGHYVSDKKMAKWHEIKATLTGRPGATLIAVAFDFQNNERQQAIQSIVTFTNAFIHQPINIKKSI